jgi:hypothetical protein
MATTPEIEALAAEIGSNVYIDVAKWHLYLSDAHLHTELAEKLYPLLEQDELSEATVEQALQSMQVGLGGGKTQLSLKDLVPAQVQTDLFSMLEEYKSERL